MKNQILIIIATALLSLCIGFAIPNVMGGKVQGLKVDQEQLKRNAAKQFEEEMARIFQEDLERRKVEELRAQVAAVKEMLLKLPKEQAKMLQAQMDKETQAILDKANVAYKQTRAKPAEEIFVEIPAENTAAAAPKGGAATSGGADVKNGSIQSKIDANRDKIDDKDLQEGRVYYNSVDTGYLAGLMEDGLTPEEDAEMQNYLKQCFSPGEYERAKELYYKYVHLLNE